MMLVGGVIDGCTKGTADNVGENVGVIVGLYEGLLEGLDVGGEVGCSIKFMKTGGVTTRRRNVFDSPPSPRVPYQFKPHAAIRPSLSIACAVLSVK